MDPLSTGLMDFTSIFSGVLIFGMIFAYVIPVLLLGFMFYYFTGEKYGRGIMQNLMRVSLRVYNQVWFLIGAITAFIGVRGIFDYIFIEIIEKDFYGYDDAKMLLSNALVLIVGLLLVAIHFLFNNRVQTEIEKKGTVVTKLFQTLGIVIFSIVLFVTTLTFVDNFLSYAYDETEYFGAGALATLVASLFFWIIYVANTYKTFTKESTK